MNPSARRVAELHLSRQTRRADAHLSDEWLRGRRDALAAVTGAPVDGGDFEAVARGIGAAADSLQETLSGIEAASRNHPYFLRELEWFREEIKRVRAAVREYVQFDKNLSSHSGAGAFWDYVVGYFRASYRKSVHRIEDAFAEVPYLQDYKVGEVLERARKSAPAGMRFEELTPEVVAYLKTKRVMATVVRAAFNTYRAPDPGRLLDRLFTVLSENPRTDESYGAVREAALGRARVVILDPANEPEMDAAILKAFSRVRGELERAGFGDVWYGPLVYASREQGALTGEQLTAARGAGYNFGSYSGRYNFGDDLVVVHGYPDEAANTLAHELGHRYWFRFMTREQRLRFNEWVSTRPAEIEDTDSARARYLEEMDYFPGEVDDEGRPKELPPVSYYGGTNAHEAFAEAFMYYVRGKHMTREQRVAFRHLLGIR